MSDLRADLRKTRARSGAIPASLSADIVATLTSLDPFLTRSNAP